MMSDYPVVPSDSLATDLPEMSAPVPSPCVSLCKMDAERRYCLGCMRTIEEIIQWSKADDDYKRGVWQEIRRREQLIDFD